MNDLDLCWHICIRCGGCEACCSCPDPREARVLKTEEIHLVSWGPVLDSPWEKK